MSSIGLELAVCTHSIAQIMICINLSVLVMTRLSQGRIGPKFSARQCMYLVQL